MNHPTRLRHSWMLCLPLLLNTQAVQAQDQWIDLQSGGGYTSYRLPNDTTQVDLTEQLQGTCRFNRTWGYDLTNLELWTNGGCGGRFKVTRSYAAPDNNGGSNAAAAAAAVAAIAGIALLANQNRHDRDQRPDQPGYGGDGGGREIRVDGRLCLDVTKGNIRPGTPLQVYDCNGTASQRFSVGRGGEIRVRDLCLDTNGGDPRDGAGVVLWACSGSRSQSWATRGGQIVNQVNGKCLDVENGQVRQGAPTMMWSCNRSPSQRWWW